METGDGHRQQNRFVTRTKKIGVSALIVAVLAYVICFRGPSILDAVLVQFGFRKASIPVAVYETFSISGRSVGTELRFGTMVGENPGRLPTLYLKHPEGRCFSVSELSEQDVSRLTDDIRTYENGAAFWTVYIVENCRFVFEDGKLVEASIPKSSDIQFALHKDGPYYRLPISRETMYELFGKPKRWGRESVMGF